MKKTKQDVKLVFRVAACKVTDNLYPESLEVVDWDWHDGTLRIYVRELK